MRRPSDTTMAVIVMVSIATVLAGPVLGRLGFERLANAAVILAAGCGLVAFLLAAAGTAAALRRDARDVEHPEERNRC